MLRQVQLAKIFLYLPLKEKLLPKNIFSKAAPKISPRSQFIKIKEALKEVELIEAGKVKPKSLDELLDEL